MSFDEFNDFLCRTPRRVQTAAFELGQNALRRVSRKSTSRVTLTAGVIFSMLHKGKILVMMRSCSREQRKLIERDFGDRCVFVAGEKWMSRKLHTEVVIPRVILPLAEKLRQERGKGTSQFVLCLHGGRSSGPLRGRL